MTKKLDMSVLTNGFLIEYGDFGNRGYPKDRFILLKMDELVRRESHRTYGPAYRPALNHWHFNDGTMVLPDGLVVDLYLKKQHQNEELEGLYAVTETNQENDESRFLQNMPEDFFDPREYLEYDEVSALKILGVTEEYRESGQALSMSVVEL